MILRRLTEHVKTQNWFAVVLDLAFSSSSDRSRLASLAFGGLRNLQPAVPGLPVVDGRFRHAVPPGQIGRLRASLGLVQKPDDLLSREPRSLHRPSSFKGRTLIDRGGKSGGQVSFHCIRWGLRYCVVRS